MNYSPLVIFWISVITVIYVYGGYYLFLRLLAFARTVTVKKDERFRPSVSIIVSAHNEAGSIENRILNLLKLDYPKDKLEIIIGSDGSSDDTAAVSRRYERQGVKVLDFPQNRGKALTHNDCAKAAVGEIIVFTDAESEFDRDFLLKLVSNHADPSVGCVVGRLRFKSVGGAISTSEGLYFRYELAIRALESRTGLLATGTGACFSVRKRLFIPLEPVDDSDFTTPIDCVKAGYRVVYEPDAKAVDRPASGMDEEIRSRIRMTAKNFIGTIRRLGPGFQGKYPLVFWGLVSHKFLRWLTGYFILAAFLSNLALLDSGGLYVITMVIQGIGAALVFAGYLANRFDVSVPLASHAFSFFIAVYGMTVGVFNGLTGKISVRWSKR